MICRTTKETIEARPHRAFISYAHVEKQWRERLVQALEPLRNDGFVDAWHDDMLLPGDRFHAKILSRLADAELVVLLVSPALLKSEYVQAHEIPLALERAESGRCRVVPVLLESCDWTKQGFARYQALPGDKLPLAERSDVDEALADCLERLRRVFAPTPSGGFDKSDKSEVPVLCIQFAIPGGGLPSGAALIDTARKIARDDSVRTNRVERLPASEGDSGKSRWEWRLEGSSEAFRTIEDAHRKGLLSGALGFEAISVERALGAVFFAGTYVAAASEAPPPLDRTLRTGMRSEPPRLFGIAVRPSSPEWLLPFFTKMGTDMGDEDWRREKEKLLTHFYTVLAVPGDDVHINLSAFERSRVMPGTLARTALGRLLAEQDCMLKQLTASMLHPETSEGGEFWRRIERRAGQSGKSGPLEMWQKVWIVAGDATLNEKAAGETYDHPLPPGYEIRREDWFGHLSECSMRVMCETDYLALGKRSEEAGLTIGPGDSFHKEALDIFRETILPGLTAEVNEGVHFAPLRQVYWAVALAKWYRENVAARGAHTRLLEVAAEMRAGLGDSAEIGPGPGAPSWMNECYEGYLELLGGVFQVRKAEGDSNRVRVYHSGGVHL
jgi:hypothetical protein